MVGMTSSGGFLAQILLLWSKSAYVGPTSPCRLTLGDNNEILASKVVSASEPHKPAPLPSTMAPDRRIS